MGHGLLGVKISTLAIGHILAIVIASIIKLNVLRRVAPSCEIQVGIDIKPCAIGADFGHRVLFLVAVMLDFALDVSIPSGRTDKISHFARLIGDPFGHSAIGCGGTVINKLGHAVHARDVEIISRLWTAAAHAEDDVHHRARHVHGPEAVGILFGKLSSRKGTQQVATIIPRMKEGRGASLFHFDGDGMGRRPSARHAQQHHGRRTSPHHSVCFHSHIWFFKFNVLSFFHKKIM